MPEYPDLTIYVEALAERVVGEVLQSVRLQNPFLLRTVSPALDDLRGLKVEKVSRRGKRLVLAFKHDLFLLLHLMIAGRLHWKSPNAAIPKSNGLLALDFPSGTLLLTESGSKRRASLHVVQGRTQIESQFPVGLEVMQASPAQFASVLRRENHTLKRALTDPHLFSGLGNAYSDEILHRARLSPVLLTGKITDEQIGRLFPATRAVLKEWTDRLRRETAGRFPEKVTAFHAEMAVHGRFGMTCPVCGTPIQRIRRAENEINYCPACQTGGRLLADRALSALLKKDWPRSLEEMDALKARVQAQT